MTVIQGNLPQLPAWQPRVPLGQHVGWGPFPAVALDGMQPGAGLAQQVQWSQGYSLVIAPPAQSTTPKPFTVLSWTLAFSLALLTGRKVATENASALPSYGRLGKLIGGVVLNQPSFETLGWFGTLPSNLGGVETLWDPGSDPLPPQQGVFDPNQPTEIKSMNPPQPILVEQGDTLQFGIWQFPMLAQNTGLALLSARYTIYTGTPS